MSNDHLLCLILELLLVMYDFIKRLILYLKIDFSRSEARLWNRTTLRHEQVGRGEAARDEQQNLIHRYRFHLVGSRGVLRPSQFAANVEH